MYKKILILLLDLFILNCLSKGEKCTYNAFSGPTITVHISGASPTETLSIRVWKEMFITAVQGVAPDSTVVSKLNENGDFVFNISKFELPVYFSLEKTFNEDSGDVGTILHHFIVEPSDDVKINIGKLIQVKNQTTKLPMGWRIDDVSFEGNGALKYQCRYACDTMELSIAKALANIDIIDSIREEKIKILNRYRGALSSSTYAWLMADISGEARKYKCKYYNFYYKKPDSSSYGKLKDLFSKLFSNNSLELFPDSLKLLSKDLFESEYQIALYRYRLLSYTDTSQSFISFIDQRYVGLLKEKILTTYLLHNFHILNNANEIMDKVLNKIHTPFYKNVLFELSTNLSNGSVAFDFTLPDANNKLVRLSDYKGKVVLIDFWYIGCVGCVHFYKTSLSFAEKEFKKDSNVIFVTISIDKDKQRWIRNGINGGLYTSTNENIINLYTGGSGENHEVISRYKVFTYPKPIVIDRSGRIFNSNTIDLYGRSKLKKIIQEALKYQPKH